MKKHIPNLLFAIAVLPLLVAVQCKRETPTPKPVVVTPTKCDTCLPDITTTGKNTFGCRVNGKVWLPKEDWNEPGAWAEYFNQGLTIHSYNSAYDEHVNLSFAPALDTLNIVFPDHTLQKSWAIYLGSNNSKFYLADTIKCGSIHFLRLDLAKGIVSGTFSFDAYDIYGKHNGDTVHITDGRFDIHL